MFKKLYRISLLLMMLSLTFVGLISQTLADDSGSTTCPVGQGYWKNTPTWPLVQLTLGSQNYTQVEVLIILNTPPQGDASLILAHQLIAAKLNAANGRDTTVVAGVIEQGDAVLAGFTGRLPYNVPPPDAAGQTLVNLSTILTSYNEGQLTLGCVLPATPTPTGTLTVTPPTPTVIPTLQGTVTPATATPQGTMTITPTVTAQPNQPVIIVIEGPVQVINVNIITIYNINIQLNVDDPNLKIIQVGDVVRVSGSPQGSTVTGNITIIAITVVIVNVDINVSTGDVWRDDNSCSNPPPPGAPANGWRRRCEGNDNKDDKKEHKEDKKNNKHDDDDD
jgi:hypothetical protein